MSASGTVTFAPGETTRQFSVSVLGDRVAEYQDFGDGAVAQGQLANDLLLEVPELPAAIDLYERGRRALEEAGGSVDAVEEGETGFLVPPAEPDHLAVAIEAMMANPALRARMGAAARRRADAEYRVERVMPVLEHLYETLARAEQARR